MSIPEKYKAIEQARTLTDKTIEEIAKAVGPELVPPDCALVFFGSLARKELTPGSDLDWTLLVDGKADPTHHEVALQIGKSLVAAGFNEPSKTGSFGQITFSHDLIHRIGGDDDSNKNTTQRLLLLLESVSLPLHDCQIVRDRVVKGILRRYLEHERNLFRNGSTAYKVPRFLLNDTVRFWRTMAVDYAYKVREREAKKWALRNIKLRFSRKLLLVQGLLGCFSCRLSPSSYMGSLEFGAGPELLPMVDHIQAFFQKPPLDNLLASLDRDAPKQVDRAFAAYDRFLQALEDESQRCVLKKLKPENADSNELFQELRKEGHEFQKSLEKLFYDSNPDMRALMLEYGVF